MYAYFHIRFLPRYVTHGEHFSFESLLDERTERLFTANVVCQLTLALSRVCIRDNVDVSYVIEGDRSDI